MIIDWSNIYTGKQEMYYGVNSEKSFNWIILLVTSAFPFTYYFNRNSKWGRSSANV